MLAIADNCRGSSSSAVDWNKALSLWLAEFKTDARNTTSKLKSFHQTAAKKRGKSSASSSKSSSSKPAAKRQKLSNNSFTKLWAASSSSFSSASSSSTVSAASSTNSGAEAAETAADDDAADEGVDWNQSVLEQKAANDQHIDDDCDLQPDVEMQAQDESDGQRLGAARM